MNASMAGRTRDVRVRPLIGFGNRRPVLLAWAWPHGVVAACPPHSRATT